MEDPTNPENSSIRRGHSAELSRSPQDNAEPAEASSIRRGHSAELSRSPQDDAEPAEASTFIEDLQKATQELEADIQREKTISHPQPDYNLSTPPQKHIPVKEEVKESFRSSERGFDRELTIQAEEVAEEKKRLEEIQKNLEKEQKMVAEYIQELTVLQGEISKVLEGKKKIEDGLWKIRRKESKIFADLKDPNSFWFPK